MIWHFAFEPRRVIVDNWTEAPRIDPKTERFLEVNCEAREIWLKNYTYSLNLKGRFGPHINFEIDTLCVNGVDHLYALVHQFPSTMNRIRYIDVYVESNRFDFEPFDVIPDLKVLSSKCLLTVRWDTNPATTENPDGEDPSGAYVINALGVLRTNLLRCHACEGRELYSGPKVAAVFPGSSAFRHDIYFQSTDLQHASFGRIILKGPSKFQELHTAFKVKWTAKDFPWIATTFRYSESIYTYVNISDIFGYLYSTRIPWPTPKQKKLHSIRHAAQMLKGGRYGIHDFLILRDAMDHWTTPGWVTHSAAGSKERAATIEHYKDYISNPLAGLAPTVDGDILLMYERVHKTATPPQPKRKSRSRWKYMKFEPIN